MRFGISVNSIQIHIEYVSNAITMQIPSMVIECHSFKEGDYVQHQRENVSQYRNYMLWLHISL